MSQMEFNKKGEIDNFNYRKKEIDKMARKELLVELSIFITSGNVPVSDIITEECSSDNELENMIQKDVKNNDSNNNQNKADNGKSKSVISYSRRAIDTKTGTIHDFVNILASSGKGLWTVSISMIMFHCI